MELNRIKPKQFLKLINPTGEHLTPDKLRTFKGFEQRSDSEAIDIIDSLRTLAEIVVGNCLKRGTIIDNQQVVHLSNSTQSNNKAA